MRLGRALLDWSRQAWFGEARQAMVGTGTAGWAGKVGLGTFWLGIVRCGIDTDTAG